MYLSTKSESELRYSYMSWNRALSSLLFWYLYRVFANDKKVDSITVEERKYYYLLACVCSYTYFLRLPKRQSIFKL